MTESDLDAAIVRAVGRDPNGTETEIVLRRIGRSATEAGDAFERLKARGELLGFAGLWFAPEVFQSGLDRFTAALDNAHAQSRRPTVFSVDDILRAARLQWTGKPLDRILASLPEGIEAGDGRIRRADVVIPLNARQEELLARIRPHLAEAGIAAPGYPELARRIVVPAQAIRDLLAIAARAGEVVAISDALYYLPEQVTAIQAQLIAAFGDRPFTPAEAKVALATSRKYAIPILEYLDRTGFTDRSNDERVIRRS